MGPFALRGRYSVFAAKSLGSPEEAADRTEAGLNRSAFQLGQLLYQIVREAGDILKLIEDLAARRTNLSAKISSVESLRGLRCPVEEHVGLDHFAGTVNAERAVDQEPASEIPRTRRGNPI